MARFNIPITLIIFNRPEKTRKLFKIIKNVQPKELFVIADGPRNNIPGEKNLCDLTRSIIHDIDWECKLYTNFSADNLGCGKRPATGVSWVFENVEKAIILEDDCIPHPSFFKYCEELLEKYADDERVMMISGDNFQSGNMRTRYSYYFSIFTHIWGWATWRRAWNYFDYTISLWPEIKNTYLLKNFFNNPIHINYWETLFDKVYNDKFKTYWDYQWLLSCWMQNGLTIIPSVNLVSNEGIGDGATHTQKVSKFMYLKTEAIEFPLKHPPVIIRNKQADLFTQNNNFSSKTSKIKIILKYIKKKLRM